MASAHRSISFLRLSFRYPQLRQIKNTETVVDTLNWIKKLGSTSEQILKTVGYVEPQQILSCRNSSRSNRWIWFAVGLLTMSPPSSLFRTVSPPPVSRRKRRRTSEKIGETSVQDEGCSTSPSLAAIESGEAHLDYFSKHLSKVCRPVTNRIPRLSIDDFVNLYKRNQHPHGHHFVVHQHNHPIAGVHYDLRLQFSETSCISFAIPYGLPGNPNSKKSRRMAVETRVHNLWVGWLLV